MTAFKRIVFCLLCGFACLVALMPTTPPAEPRSGIILGGILLLLASLAVPGAHVEWVSRLVSLPFVAVLGQRVNDLGLVMIRGELRVDTWEEVKNLLFLAFYAYTFGTLLLFGRLPLSVANMFSARTVAE